MLENKSKYWFVLNDSSLHGIRLEYYTDRQNFAISNKAKLIRTQKCIYANITTLSTCWTFKQ